jgi:UDP-2,3-diacylglucosamine pyrophosphatase LpxH
MPGHNFLVLSDVHLGSDLVQHTRPDAPLPGAASQRRDRELVALLDWYRLRPRGALPWRLVIAGDLVDFTGMSVSGATDEIVTRPNDDERRHGLGSSVDHTLAKLRRIAEHHQAVFAALGRFLDAGNSLVVVRGNHDVDLHWEPVKDAFRAILAKHTVLFDNVEFADWFYYEEGLVYVEHGHQYDTYCSYDHLLHPVRPSDPHRSDRSLSDVLLRYVVRPTRGMLESGHDSAGMLDYLRFAASLGTFGLLALGLRFVSATGVLVALWREHFSGATRWVRREHERRMAVLADALQISLTRLKALASLQLPPVTRSLARTLAGVMIDRILAAAVAGIVIVWLLVARWTPALGLQLGAAAALGVPLAWLWRRARGAIDASASLRERAARVAALFPATFVVMGHTHMPEVAESADGAATYVNVGAWAEEERPDNSPACSASRTHLVVEHVEGRTRGLLLRWREELGPEYFVA